jgi:hypothetical protein
MVMNFGRAALLGNAIHPRPDRLPKVTAQQAEALNAIEAIAEAARMEIRTQAGDIHFVNNLAVLHRREAFVNGDGPMEKRHLVRMRLRSDALGWEIPAALQRDWYDAFEKAGDSFWHLEPMPDGFFPLRSHPN